PGQQTPPVASASLPSAGRRRRLGRPEFGAPYPFSADPRPRSALLSRQLLHGRQRRRPGLPALSTRGGGRAIGVANPISEHEAIDRAAIPAQLLGSPGVSLISETHWPECVSSPNGSTRPSGF